jgi:hypothetical protein
MRSELFICFQEINFKNMAHVIEIQSMGVCQRFRLRAVLRGVSRTDYQFKASILTFETWAGTSGLLFPAPGVLGFPAFLE